MQEPVQGMGMGTVSGVPTDVLDSLYPFWQTMQQGPLSMALAQYSAQAQQQAAQTQANASMYGSQMDAQARAAAAAASIQAQQIQSQSALKGIAAQVAADIQRAQGGDSNARHRLQAQLGLDAQVQNQNNRMQIAGMASSTGLRDAVAARMFVHGLGPQAQFGSSMLAGPMQSITAPTVGFEGYGAAPTVDTNVGGGNWTMPSFAAPPMISGGGGSSSSLNDYFAQANSQFSDLFGNLGLNTNGTSAGGTTTPPTTTPTSTNPNTGLPYNWQQPTASPLGPGSSTNASDQPFIVGGKTIGTLHSDGTVTKLPGFAKGGNIPPQGALVGEGLDGSGLKRGTAEAIVPDEKGRLFGRVVPLRQTNGLDPLRPMASGGYLGKDAEGGMTSPPLMYGGTAYSNTGPGKRAYMKASGMTAPSMISGGTSGSTTTGGGTTVTTSDGTTIKTPGMNDVQQLPASQALLTGQAPRQGWNANMKFDLDELGMFGLNGPAQMAAMFRPGATDVQTQQDVLSQLQAGLNIPPELLKEMLMAFTPGQRQYAQPALAY